MNEICVIDSHYTVSFTVPEEVVQDILAERKKWSHLDVADVIDKAISAAKIPDVRISDYWYYDGVMLDIRIPASDVTMLSQAIQKVIYDKVSELMR